MSSSAVSACAVPRQAQRGRRAQRSSRGLMSAAPLLARPWTGLLPPPLAQPANQPAELSPAVAVADLVCPPRLSPAHLSPCPLYNQPCSTESHSFLVSLHARPIFHVHCNQTWRPCGCSALVEQERKHRSGYYWAHRTPICTTALAAPTSKPSKHRTQLADLPTARVLVPASARAPAAPAVKFMTAQSYIGGGTCSSAMLLTLTADFTVRSAGPPCSALLIANRGRQVRVCDVPSLSVPFACFCTRLTRF